MQVKKQQLEPEMEEETGSKLGKEYVKAAYSHSTYFYAEYIMWNAGLGETQARIKMPGEISTTSEKQITPALWQKAKKN